MFPLPSPSSFTTARWIFARVLGAIFFFAFVSLWVQVRGLAGEQGIMPAQEFLNAVWNNLGANALWQVPTLCWINASGTMLVTLCAAGALVSILMICGFFPGLCALVAWGLYLSLCWIGNPFLSFQWDALLLETGLLAVALLPWSPRPDWKRWTPLQQAGLWLLWWLLFRLMFESGAVKLASGDATWRSLTALDFHFETQPLPLWTAWYANQIPDWILCMMTFVMFIIEFGGPLLILAPRRLRHGGALALIALQVVILATGNYAFFNFLTIALCLLLLDDKLWPTDAPWPLGNPESVEPWLPWKRWTIGCVASLIFLITMQPLISSVGLVQRWPAPFSTLRAATEGLMSFNGYGLFAVMTTSRHEITIEGSYDNKEWRPYEFRWKPDDLDERPKLIAPHQPRLDWQMWFAALSDVQSQPWFVRFLVRLLEGSPDVLQLLRSNPFPGGPPRFIRAVAYEYHFTRSGDGNHGWWKREPLGLYCPAIGLVDGKPRLVKSGESAPPK